MINFRVICKTALFITAIQCVLSIGSCFGQSTFQDRYAIAKGFFRDGKYNLAMESFKALIPYDQSNPFSEYASFYYSLSAYQEGYHSVAKDMLLQIRTLYPSWDKLDEVNIWLAKIHFEKNEYAQGLQALSQIKSNKAQKEVIDLKKHGIASIQDVELLKSLLQQYQDDAHIAEKLVYGLSKSQSPADLELRDLLINRFHFKKSDFVEEIPKTIHKDVYTVSVLFPFVVNTLEPTINRKRNQFVLDLYEGMKLAVDTLSRQGVKISFRAYDTERNVDKLQQILERDELRSSDLIIGPLFQEENAIVQNFSRDNQINLFNPLSSNSDLIEGNPYGFLFQPSLETIGARSGRFLSAIPENKKCMVFYGEGKRDSILAANFLNSISGTDMKVLMVERITKETFRKVTDILATPTEFDEFKYPKQFTLPKDSLDCIYVATDDPLIYTKVISSIETRGDGVMILGYESWLDQAAVDYEKYQSLNIVVAAPNFTPEDNAWYKAFQKKFIRVHGRTPSTNSYSSYAKLGYNFMLFAGHALKKHGVYFQEELKKEKWIPGFLTEGYDYQNGQDNQSIPFLKFEGGKLVVIDQP